MVTYTSSVIRIKVWTGSFVVEHGGPCAYLDYDLFSLDKYYSLQIIFWLIEILHFGLGWIQIVNSFELHLKKNFWNKWKVVKGLYTKN